MKEKWGCGGGGTTIANSANFSVYGSVCGTFNVFYEPVRASVILSGVKDRGS